MTQISVVYNRKTKEVTEKIAWGSNEFVWSLYNNLSFVISEGCRKLAETECGMPGRLYSEAIIELYGEDMLEPIIWHFHENEEKALAASDLAAEKWRIILEKIATGFDVYRNYDIIANPEGVYEEPYQSQVNEAWDLFREWFRNLWD
jgi:hypothetical protein